VVTTNQPDTPLFFNCLNTRFGYNSHSASKKESKVSAETACAIKRFYHRKARTDLRSLPRTWRTRKDPFADVWNEVRLQLELNPDRSPKGILKELIEKHPDSFNPYHLRTLQRRVAEWHRVQQELLSILVFSQSNQAAF